MLPLLIMANLLATFRPREKHWWEYLDQIWESAETADRTSLPALMLRARKQLLAASLSAHGTVINGSALCAALAIAERDYLVSLT